MPPTRPIRPKVRSPRKQRRGRKSHRKGWGRFKAALALLLVLSAVGGGILLGWRFRSALLDLRKGRAQDAARRVFSLTARPAQEQEQLAELVARYAVARDLNPAVVAAIIVVESGGNPLTVSSSGDLGLMQVNVRIHAKSFDFQQQNLLNPETNIAVGTTILKTMLDRHGEQKAIAAYNGLVPEKSEYAKRVQAVLHRAGFAPGEGRVAGSTGVASAATDWLEVLSSGLRAN
ncbi:MAG: lytic transglycosylase domain-containing protein [Acidobacteriota bacterium]